MKLHGPTTILFSFSTGKGGIVPYRYIYVYVLSKDPLPLLPPGFIREGGGEKGLLTPFTYFLGRGGGGGDNKH